jgi:hypothetical protein
LTEVMHVVLRAWELREAARQCVGEGNQPKEAVRLARAACQLHATPQARKLLALALLANQELPEAQEVMLALLTGQELPQANDERETVS